MMAGTYETFNEVLVKLYNDIMAIEEKAVITEEFKDISNNDMHIIEAIGIDFPKSMSVIAAKLSITVGTLTIAINNLVKKGYALRNRSPRDKRVVLISLSEKGIKAFKHHADFHEEMIHAIIKDFSDEEVELVVKALSNLVTFFKSKI
ncbi:MAG: MarR family transcriptional regulator [Lachnospiraceae bacterium]